MRQSVQSRIAVSHQLGDGENAVPDGFTARRVLIVQGFDPADPGSVLRPRLMLS